MGEDLMFHKRLLIVGAAAVGFLVAASAARAENRVALVIGNSSYEHVPALTNPANDAQGVTAILKLAGFDVSLKLDLNQTDMRLEVRDFAQRVTETGPDSVALIFYAGHGLQMEGESYLVPVDAQIKREADVAIETVRLSDLTKALDSVPSRMRIVILDACRNNPFAEQAKIPGHGLAIVDAPTGSIVAYSTAPGSEAEDGIGVDSPFTAALLGAITEPNLQIERFFKQVRLRVHKATDGRQTPWESSSLTSDFAFFGAALPAIATAKEDEIHTSVARPTPATISGAGARDAELRSAAVHKHARLEEIHSRPANDAYSLVIEEDSIELYQEFIKVYGSDPLAPRVRGLLGQRLEMVAWYMATATNTVASYEAFLERYPSSDYASVAKRMLERVRQRGINPVTAGAFAGPGGPIAAQAAACPPSEPRPIPIRATPPTLQPPPIPTLTPPPGINKPSQPPVTHLEPPATIKHHEPPVTMKHHEPPAGDRHHEPLDRHSKKKSGKEATEVGHKKSRSARAGSRSHDSGEGDRPVPAHSSDDGGAVAGGLLGAAVGIAIGGGFHHGGGGGGFHHSGGWHPSPMSGHHQ
jgi:Caspase domain